MTNFIVDPSSVSQASIKADLQTYLDNAPDTAKWKDFFASGTGQTIIELIAGLGALLNYNVIAARREAFLPYAQNRSSAIACSETLGYSAFRGRNQVVDVTFIPNTTGTLAKWTPIAVVKDQDLILLDNLVVNSGTSVTARCIVGSIDSQTLTATSTAPALFRFNTAGVSSDIRLFLNSTEVNMTEKVLDLISEKFVALTNIYGSVDVAYLNLDTFTTRYTTGSTLELRWITLTSSTFAFTQSDIKFLYGTLTTYSSFSVYQSQESIESIKINAPLANETQFVIRGRNDYLKTFRLSNSNILFTSGEDISPAVVRLYYIMNDLSILTALAKSNIIALLETYRPFGVQPPTIADPNINFLRLAISVTLLPNVGAVNPTLDIDTLLELYRKKLGNSISFHDLENTIDDLSYIKISRIAFNPYTWTLNTLYRRGHHVVPTVSNGFIYEMNRKVYYSNSTEPVWPTASFPNYDANLGTLVIDNGIVWKVVLAPLTITPAWQSNHQYNEGDLVIATNNTPLWLINKAFQVVDFINKSGCDTNATKATGSYSGVDFTADNFGIIGNLIILAFDGIKTVTTVVNDWNTANPTNTVSFSPLLQGTSVLAAASIQLAGGLGTKAETSYSGFTFTAANFGVEGNLIKLSFDNIKSVSLVVNTWNLSEPTNTVTFTGGSGSTVLPTGIAELAGGTSAVNAEPAWPLTGVC